MGHGGAREESERRAGYKNLKRNCAKQKLAAFGQAGVGSKQNVNSRPLFTHTYTYPHRPRAAAAAQYGAFAGGGAAVV